MRPAHKQIGRRRWGRLFSGYSLGLGALVLIHSALLAYSANIHSPTIDEPAHLAAGLSHWHVGDFSLYRVNPPLVRMIATSPLLLTSIETDWTEYTPGITDRREMAVGESLVRANGSRIFWYTTIARWACIPFSLIGLIASRDWAKLLFGKRAGLVAAILYSFSPTILGHGALMTPDVAGTALGLAACYAYFRWLIAPGWWPAILAGLLLGAAECCKSTWILLFPGFVSVWLAFVLYCNPAPRPSSLQLALILCFGWLLLVGIYGGKGIGAPLGTLTFQSKLFRRMCCTQMADKEPMRPALAKLPLPLPRDYLVGLDAQLHDLEGPNDSFLHGEWRSCGWWYYYAYGLAVKEPTGLLALAGISLAFWCTSFAVQSLRNRFSRRRRHFLTIAGLMALFPVAIFVIASAHTGMNHHVRYVMPVVPLLGIISSGVAVGAGACPRIRIIAAYTLTGYMAISSLATYPHSLSYFNELVGGPARGIQHLNNSNIDWGQDLIALRKWKVKYSPTAPIYLAYFGRINPNLAGIDFRLPPQSSLASAEQSQARLPQLEPGWYAVSATLLQGRAYMIPTPDGGLAHAKHDDFGYFRQLTPAYRVGYSIHVFRVDY